MNYQQGVPTLTPIYSQPIGLNCAEFLRCLVAPTWGDLKNETMLQTSFYSTHNSGKVMIFFDRMQGISPNDCDYYFELDEWGIITAAQIMDAEHTKEIRKWVGKLVQDKVVITGVPHAQGAMLLTVSHRGDYVQ